eukprot:3860307-Pleurochrysis_carterae.AAC.1
MSSCNGCALSASEKARRDEAARERASKWRRDSFNSFRCESMEGSRRDSHDTYERSPVSRRMSNGIGYDRTPISRQVSNTSGIEVSPASCQMSGSSGYERTLIPIARDFSGASSSSERIPMCRPVSSASLGHEQASLRRQVSYGSEPERYSQRSLDAARERSRERDRGGVSAIRLMLLATFSLALTSFCSTMLQAIAQSKLTTRRSACVRLAQALLLSGFEPTVSEDGADDATQSAVAIVAASPPPPPAASPPPVLSEEDAQARKAALSTLCAHSLRQLELSDTNPCRVRLNRNVAA